MNNNNNNNVYDSACDNPIMNELCFLIILSASTRRKEKSCLPLLVVIENHKIGTNRMIDLLLYVILDKIYFAVMI